MLSCKDMSRLLSDELDTQLPRNQRLAMTAHLLLCRTCRRYRLQLRFLQKAVQQLDGQVPGLKLSTGAKERIKQKLSDED